MKTKKRRTVLTNARPVGTGGDGHSWEVTTVTTDGAPYAHRAKPCATCPFRRDSEIGRFPPDAYRHAAHVAYDMDPIAFSCHESGVEAAATCAGFLLVAAEHNMAVRLAVINGRLKPDSVGNPDGVPLYASYAEMAIANGVPADDPILAPCRGPLYD